MERESGVQRCWLSEMKFAHKTIWARYLGAIYWSVSCLKGTDNDWAVTMAEKTPAPKSEEDVKALDADAAEKEDAPVTNP